MLVERVLIHPFPDTKEWPKLCKVWRQWENFSTTRIIPIRDFRSLEDINYLSDVDSQLTIGGQAGTVCVATHLSHLAKSKRVINGLVQLSVSKEATLIEDIALQYVLRKILVEQQVSINITN